MNSRDHDPSALPPLPPPSRDTSPVRSRDRISLEEHVVHSSPYNTVRSSSSRHDDLASSSATATRLLSHFSPPREARSSLSPERTLGIEEKISPERELEKNYVRDSHMAILHGSLSPRPVVTSPLSEPENTPAPSRLSSTPPPTHPSASSFGMAASTAGTEHSSTMSAFEVLSGYEPVSMKERHRQWQREQVELRQQAAQAQAQAHAQVQVNGEGFRPNSDLPFPITPQLLRYYPFGSSNGNSSNRHAPPPQAQSPDYLRGAPLRARGYFEQIVSPTPMSRGFEGVLGSRLERAVGAYESGGWRSGGSSEVGGTGSGIPSYAREFGGGWRMDPIPTESSHPSPTTSRSPPAPTSNASSHSNSNSIQPQDSIASAYIAEFATQLDSLLRWAKRPFISLFITSLIVALVSLIVQSIPTATLPLTPFPVATTSNGSYETIETRKTFYADFPTLMNIESSFEKIVDSAAGGSALARVMKQSEMAVSDLSTVVRYSDLKCKDTLAERLDVFARDAKGNVRALQSFGSKVGGVLDQLLSINQYALRELHNLAMHPPPPPASPLSRLISTLTPSFLTPSSPPPTPESPQTKARISETFNAAAEVLERNLRLLVSDGETIFASLTQLTEQHKPIYDEIVREVVDIKREEAVVLSSLWTKVGGNSAQRKNFRENAQLLALIGSYEEQARGYVESTVLELDRMTADLEGLRRRVAEPLLVGEGRKEGGIPLGVHLEAVERAVERLVWKRRERRERDGGWMLGDEGLGVAEGINVVGEDVLG